MTTIGIETKKRRLSRAGLIFSLVYLCFVAFCLMQTERCFRSNDLFCAIGYLLPGLPWSWVLLMTSDYVFTRFRIDEPSNLIFLISVPSMILNLFLSYWLGRVV